MDEFDYLNGTLTEWLDEFFVDADSVNIKIIETEYLPRFEAALHKNTVQRMSGKIL